VQTGPATASTGVRGSAAAAPKLHVEVKSLLEQKWSHVVRQRTDIGCGAASLATILTYYFDFPTDEDEMVQALHSEALAAPAPNLERNIRFNGFNLRQIRNVAKKGGLVAAAFRVKPEDLPDVKLPVITRVTIRGYDHFVVFKEARNGRVFIADPAFGNTVYRLRDFEKIWSGVMMGFLRRGQGPVAQHLLQVAAADQRNLTWRETSRLLRPKVPAAVRLPAVFLTAPVVDPSVLPESLQGLSGSALPTFIFNTVDFGGEITF